MTTMHHQWLAKAFIPGSIIDEVMSKQQTAIDGIAGLGTGAFKKTSEKNDTARQKKLKVGDADCAGNKIIVNDIDEQIVISSIKTLGSSARMLQVNDPSRVFVGTTEKKGESGMTITELMEKYDAIAGINASGFYDPLSDTEGGEVLGLSMSQGEGWGGYRDDFDSICFTADDHLIAGRIRDWSAFGIRDGIQFTPVLVIDGHSTDPEGFGEHPRTCIGQRDDGSVLMLVADGRKINSGLGMTLSECAEIMVEYGAETAAACDGGATAVMGYDGEALADALDDRKTNGRMLPDAFLIRSIK